MSADNAVSNSVRKLRWAQGLTLDGLSAALGELGYGMSVKVLSKAETGQRRWLAADLPPLAEVLGVSVATLLDVPEAHRVAGRLTLAAECGFLFAAVGELCRKVDELNGES